MGACPNGAVPTSAGQTAQWLWVGFASYVGSKLAEWERIAPWITGAIADQLVSIPNLCASNPDPPEPITVQDVLGVVIDPIAGPIIGNNFYQKVWDNLLYDAFTAFCQCNLPGTCGPFDIDTSLSTNLEYNTNFPGYGWPTSQPGVNSASDFHRTFYTLDPTCTDVDVTFWELPNTGATTAHNPVRIRDCGAIRYNQANIENNPIQVIWTPSGTVGGCPGLNIEFAYNVTPTAHPNWHFRIAPHAGSVTPPAIPPAPPDQTSPLPPHPPLKCDTATLCAINWNIVSRINVAISSNTTNTNTILANEPTTYVTGVSYTVSGSGVQVVAQATLGVVVQLVTVPTSYVPTQTEPPRYYDIGWIMMGAADALDGKKWFHSSGDRFIPAFPEIDRVHYNCSPGVTITLTELLPPQPPT